MGDFPILTERLALRPWTDADHEAFAGMSRDVRVMRFINNGKPLTDEQIVTALARRQEHQAEHGYCMWAVVDRELDAVVGVCGIQPLPGTDETGIGWWLRPTHWGRGLATEAATAARDFAFGPAGLTRLVAIAHPDNTASTRVMEKLGLGFVRLTTLGELCARTDERRDEPIVYYALERSPGTASPR